jgi:hypothetical protein
LPRFRLPWRARSDAQDHGIVQRACGHDLAGVAHGKRCVEHEGDEVLLVDMIAGIREGILDGEDVLPALSVAVSALLAR